MKTEGISSDQSTDQNNGVDSSGDAGNPVSSDKMEDLKSAYQEKGIQGLLEELAKLIEEMGAKPETPPGGEQKAPTGQAEPPGGEKAPSIEEIIKQIVKELKLSEGENQELTDGTTGKQAAGDDQTATDTPPVSHQDAMHA
jgi:hypothetical protein